jgi:hypothetical protein
VTPAVLPFLAESLLVTFDGSPLGELQPPSDVLSGRAVAQAVETDAERCAVGVRPTELEEFLGAKVIVNLEGARFTLDSGSVWDSEENKE